MAGVYPISHKYVCCIFLFFLQSYGITAAEIGNILRVVIQMGIVANMQISHTFALIYLRNRHTTPLIAFKYNRSFPYTSSGSWFDILSSIEWRWSVRESEGIYRTKVPLLYTFAEWILFLFLWYFWAAFFTYYSIFMARLRYSFHRVFFP